MYTVFLPHTELLTSWSGRHRQKQTRAWHMQGSRPVGYSLSRKSAAMGSVISMWDDSSLYTSPCSRSGRKFKIFWSTISDWCKRIDVWQSVFWGVCHIQQFCTITVDIMFTLWRIPRFLSFKHFKVVSYGSFETAHTITDVICFCSSPRKKLGAMNWKLYQTIYCKCVLGTTGELQISIYQCESNIGQ